MNKNPDDRYQSAHGLLHDLERSRLQRLSGGNDSGFPLGAQDVPERFQLPAGVYGREHEIEAIMAAFASASRGAKELVLLTGLAVLLGSRGAGLYEGIMAAML